MVAGYTTAVFLWWLRQIAHRRLWHRPVLDKLLADHFRTLPPVPDRTSALAGTMGWIRASFEKTGDGGSSAFWEPGQGWKASYPETTGYLLPTLYHHAVTNDDRTSRDLARRGAEWLVRIQAPAGGWQALQVDSPAPLRVFNSAMVLDGLAAAWERDGDSRFRDAGLRGLRWVLSSMDADGRFSRANFSEGGAFDALVVACQLEMARFADDELQQQARAAARVALDRVCGWQTPSGWFANCNEAARYRSRNTALLHHVGYTLDGLLRAGLLLEEPRYVDAARRGGAGLLAAFERQGSMSAEMRDGWEPYFDRSLRRFSWCLTGMSQVAIVWLRLARHDRDRRFLDGARHAIDLVSRVANQTWDEMGMSHGVQGSYPLGSWYQAFEFVNWAAKYHVESLLLERETERAFADAPA
jgi:hypothetical protein